MKRDLTIGVKSPNQSSILMWITKNCYARNSWWTTINFDSMKTSFSDNLLKVKTWEIFKSSSLIKTLNEKNQVWASNLKRQVIKGSFQGDLLLQRSDDKN